MLRLALRNLLENRLRLAVSLGGVALALALMLSFDAIVEGAQSRLTAFMNESQADLFVSQQGVRNLHMASSTLPASVVPTVRGTAGVEVATPILYVTNIIAVRDGAGDTRPLCRPGGSRFSMASTIFGPPGT